MSPRPVGDRGPEDFLARLATLEQAMGRFQSAFPDRAEGWDEARTVQVAWSAADGFEVVTVVRDWERRVSAQALGAAVTAAWGAALASRGEEADRALQNDEVWQDIQAGRPTRTPPPPVADPVPEQTPTADPVALAEEVLATVARVEAEPDAAAPTGRGAAGGGAVEIDLDATGLQRCEIDPRWAAGRSGLVVVGALQQAVGAARAALAAPTTEASALGALDGLIAQLMTTLRTAGDTTPGGHR